MADRTQVIKVSGKAQTVFKQIGMLANARSDDNLLSLIDKTLKYQDECPRCGVSWQTVEDMFHDPIDSDNCQAAIVITRNCTICHARFKDELKRLGI